MAFVHAVSLPRTGLAHSSTAVCSKPAVLKPVTAAPLEIRAAKHVQFKAAKKAERYRPRKHRPSDINRKPPPFDPNPLGAEGMPDPYNVIPQAASGETTTAVAEPPADTDGNLDE
ncbi:unnamed protein product [Chondrus crispus]|uniref:Uncharacterized protein n=1 Tax=Chondrus crispus TaxID=2769 RepID=R7Q9D3_CHOCR|nr:unnamed protein product [Chondrus crispus]CDF35147.1 unnamed protein product [Chondrus crispus]|eukprot:XP_005714966.1 unnamed protein product [Chondrus crispus]